MYTSHKLTKVGVYTLVQNVYMVVDTLTHHMYTFKNMSYSYPTVRSTFRGSNFSKVQTKSSENTAF